MDTSVIEKEYNTVKRTLEAMGYKGILSTESTGLVSRILSDLIKATKAFKNIQGEKEKISSKLKVQDDLVLPLRNENLKLTKENNDLHRALIKLRDDIDVRTTSSSLSLAALTKENEELKFLLTQKDVAYKQVQTQSENLRTKLNKLFSQLFMGEGDKAIINAKGLPKAQKLISNANPSAMNTTYKKGTFELSEKLNNDRKRATKKEYDVVNVFKEEISKFNFSKQDWANDLRVAENETEKLRNEIKNLRSICDSQALQIEDFNRIIRNRDTEIKRLQDLTFLGDENREEIKAKYQSEFYAMQNEKLLNQIDFLNRENHRLNAIDYFHNHRCREEEIKRLDEEIANLTKDNEKMKKKLEKYNLNDNSVLTTGTNASIMKSRSRLNQSSLFGVNLNDQIKKLRNDKKELSRLLDEERNKTSLANKELTTLKEQMASAKTNPVKVKPEELKEARVSAVSIDNISKKNYEEVINALEKENYDLKEKIKTYDSNKETIENETLRNFKTENESLYHKINTMKQELTEKQTEIDKIKTENIKIKNELSLSHRSMKKENENEAERMTEKNNFKKEKDKLKQNLQRFADENKAAAEHIKKLEKSLKNLEQINSHLIGELAKYQPKTYEGYSNDID